MGGIDQDDWQRRAIAYDRRRRRKQDKTGARGDGVAILIRREMGYTMVENKKREYRVHYRTNQHRQTEVVRF